jgi:hypothetical protein
VVKKSVSAFAPVFLVNPPTLFRPSRALRPLRAFLATLAPGLLAPLACAAAATAEPVINGKALNTIATAQISTLETSYWAGEVFPLNRETRIARPYFTSVAAEFEWSPPGVVLEDWSAPERYSNGGFEIVARSSRAYVRGTGTVQLPGAPQVVKLVTSVNGDRSTNADEFKITTAGPRLTIRPLPTPAPAAYANAVGDFTLKSSLSTLQAKVGESVTWTLELTGTGNWPEITKLPGRVVSKDFNAVAPVLKRNLKPGSLFDGTLTEDVLLVPTKAGEYQLGPIRYTFFDPKRGKYQMITSDTFTLVVGARSALDPAANTPERYRPVNTARTPIPNSPQPLPLDPLGPGWGSLAPLTPGAEKTAVLAALAVFVLYWLWLAARRSRETDALAPRRRARTQLATVLSQLDRGTLTPADTRRLIFAWQQATIDFAGLRLTTPSSAQIAHAIEGNRHGTTGSSWAPLWRESNAALYGEHGLLATAWVMRAKAALSEQVLPEVPVTALFHPRNLLPFVPRFAQVTPAAAPVPGAPVPYKPFTVAPALAAAAPTVLMVLTTLAALGLAAVLAFAPSPAHAAEAAANGATTASAPTTRGESVAPTSATENASMANGANGAATGAMAAYQKGDFAGAEAAWKKAAAVTPLDAHAHYNLALVAAQQNRWPESMAQSLAAFCLEPGNPAIRFQFEMALDRAGIDHPLLSPFVKKTSTRYALAGQMSPGQWGASLIAGSFATALALAALLTGFYRLRPKAYLYSTGAIALLLLAFTTTAWSSLRCYGPLADEHIAVVSRNTLLCSVPTEIDTTQKTVPLPAGSLAKVDKTFLGWSRLVFPNQQTGWIRTDAVVTLYH